MRFLLPFFAAALLVPAQPAEPAAELETVVMQIQEVSTEDSTREAAETLLAWIRTEEFPEAGVVEQLLKEGERSPGETACAFAAVLDEADALLPEWDIAPETYRQGVRALAPLFMGQEPSTAYRPEPARNPSTLAELEGVWWDSELGEMLIIRGDTCRVFIPYLEHWGETAYAVRLRDRSAVGYCPALEIDFRDSGDFFAPLTYYVSGADETHFWSNGQSQRFDRLGP
jgi:hypothetical protein